MDAMREEEESVLHSWEEMDEDCCSVTSLPVLTNGQKWMNSKALRIPGTLISSCFSSTSPPTSLYLHASQSNWTHLSTSHCDLLIRKNIAFDLRIAFDPISLLLYSNSLWLTPISASAAQWIAAKRVASDGLHLYDWIRSNPIWSWMNKRLVEIVLRL